jgi:lipopolysaccharide biosynthesis protein
MRIPTARGVWRRLSGAGRAAMLAARTPGGIPRDRDLDPLSRPENFVAGMNRWIQRYTGKNRTSYPPSWRHDLGDIRASEAQRIAAVVHVHFPELLPGLLDELAAIPVPFDLVITNSSGVSIEPVTAPANAKSTWVLDVPNHGRDILPLVMLVNAGIIDRYELVLKIHTKKSAWRANHELSGSGEEWRASLTSALAGNEHNVSTILDAFADQPDLGIVTADGNVLGSDYWGGDREITGSLLRRIEMNLDGRELRFAAGSMYWMRAFVLQGLFALHLSPEDFEEEAGQVDGTTAHGIERLLGIVAEEAGYRIAERSALPEPSGNGVLYWSPEARRAPRARAIPFYLPQFHSFAENDLWWGEGFTEWSNVASAQPVFRGHRQPLLPSALGFYDLRHSQTRAAQYREATRAGIEGFMYYYYWFAGRRIMDFPIEDLHASSDVHPFCIMWANENWSRRWDGSNNDVLIGQDYEHVSADQFIQDVAHLLRDERYLRVDGKPILAVYKLALVPDFAHVIEVWRAFARDAGIGELHILSVDVGDGVGSVVGNLQELGIDGVLEFPPHNTHWEFMDTDGMGVDPRFRGRIMRYDTTVKSAEVRLRQLDSNRHPGVMVSFDNTARRQWQPDLWYGSNPYVFRRWVDITLRAIADRPASERILFINAWNEWAESAVLEPSARFGRSYSLALRDALMR